MIRFEGVSKTFRTKDGDVAAVKELDFEVAAGEFFTLLGPSGCGKTTTMRMIAGLERPDAGRISIGDQVVFSAPDNINIPTQQRDISMVFQSYAIWPHMTVFNNVAYPLKVKRTPRSEIRERVEAVLDLVGLGGLGPRQATDLSGGQQQRVALARALVVEPAVMLLDEPLSNLDAKLRTQMRIELKELQSRIGVTTVYVTHDQQEALAMSDRIAVLNAGDVAQSGAPRDIYHRPRDRFSAEFIGNTNLLKATADGPLVPGPCALDTDIGKLHLVLVEPVADWQRNFLVSVRPEAVTIAGAAGALEDAPVNRFEGLIESEVFLGESTDLMIRVGTTQLYAKGLSRALQDIGRSVRVQISPDDCAILVNERVDSEQATDNAARGTGQGRTLLADGDNLSPT